MTATPNAARKQATKPVTETLLELAYFLHATKIVGVRAPSEPRQQEAPKARSENEGSSLAS